MHAYREQATLYRAALLIGLIPGETVIRWADEIIQREPSPAPPLFDLTLTAPGDLTALRGALQPMADDTESPAIARAVLGLAYRDLATGKRGAADTVHVLIQIRKLVTLPYDWRHEMLVIEGRFMRARVGMIEMAAVEAQVHAFLAQFADAEREILNS